MGLLLGFIEVMVIDVNGCMVLDIVVVVEVIELILFFVFNDLFCQGMFIGSIIVILEGGVGGYIFVWSDQ